MKIIQIGMGKSGNLWFYRIIHELLKLGKDPIQSFIQNQPIYQIAKTWELSFPDQAGIDFLTIENQHIYYRISTIFKMPILDLDAYVNQTSHVWLQSMPCQKTEEVLVKFDKIIYIIRDPRDTAISMGHYALTDYQKKFFKPSHTSENNYLSSNLHHQVMQWVRHTRGYLSLSKKLNIHVVFYERFLDDFENECQALSQFLGIDTTDFQMKEIKDACSLKKMSKDNPNHVRKGHLYQWKHIFNKKQKILSNYLGGPYLKIMHYPLNKKDDQLPYIEPKAVLSKNIKIIEIKYQAYHLFDGVINRIKKRVDDGI